MPLSVTIVVSELGPPEGLTEVIEKGPDGEYATVPELMRRVRLWLGRSAGASAGPACTVLEERGLEATHTQQNQWVL